MSLGLSVKFLIMSKVLISFSILFFGISTIALADRAKYSPEYCIKAEVLTTKSISDGLYRVKIVEYGDNRIFAFNTKTPLHPGQTKYFLIGTTPFSFFKNEPTDVLIFEKYSECTPWHKAIDEEYSSYVIEQCSESNIQCLPRYGFYRVLNIGNRVIFENDLKNYLEVILSKELEDPILSSYLAYPIIKISDVSGKVTVDYKPSKDPCFYLQIFKNFKDFGDYISWLRCKLRP